MTYEAFLIAYGTALILPLAVIEGPFVSILTGFLAAAGYFHWYTALFLLVCGDLIGDLIYYAVGRFGHGPLVGLVRRVGIVVPMVPASVQSGLTANATKMLVIGKWTHSIGCLVLMGAGALRLSLARFTIVNLLATLPKSAVLFSVGYFATDAFPVLERHVIWGTLAFLLLGTAAIALVLRRADILRAHGAVQ